MRVLRERLLLVSLLLFLISVTLCRKVTFHYRDYKLLLYLTTLFVIVGGLKKTNFLKYVASKFLVGDYCDLKLISLTAFLSFFVTNDVALVSLIPVTLESKIRDKVKTIVFQTIASNIFSAVSPFGNPQNMYILIRYKVPLHSFILTISPILFLFPFLVIFSSRCKVKSYSEKFNNKSFAYLLLFFLFLLSFFNLLPVEINSILILISYLLDFKLQVDYPLLLTFFFLIGATNNFKFTINQNVFIFSLLLSQLVGNVQATILISTFDWKGLLWGVSVGGFGSLLGSYANLIAYKFCRDKRKFLVMFHKYSFAFLFFGTLLYFLLKF